MRNSFLVRSLLVAAASYASALAAAVVDGGAQASATQPNRHPEAPGLVELMVRSHAGDAGLLLLMLRSVEMFWPPQWGVTIVFDGEPEDDVVASVMPQWVRVRREAQPRFYDEWPMLQKLAADGVVWTRGYNRAQYGHFISDRFATAPYISILDSDAVLVASGVGSLLFLGGRAIIKASCSAKQMFRPAVEVLGLPWICSFMVDQLFTVKREHFAELRAFVARGQCRAMLKPADVRLLPTAPGSGWFLNLEAESEAEGWKECVSADFDEVWHWYIENVRALALHQGEQEGSPMMLANLHTVLGHYLWIYHREDYSWSFNELSAQRRWQLNSWGFKVRPLETCPTLSAAKHPWVRFDEPHLAKEEAEMRHFFKVSPHALDAALQGRREQVKACKETCGKLQRPFVDSALALMSAGECLERRAARGPGACDLQIDPFEILVRVEPDPRTVDRWCAHSAWGNRTVGAMIDAHLAWLATRAPAPARQ